MNKEISGYLSQAQALNKGSWKIYFSLLRGKVFQSFNSEKPVKVFLNRLFKLQCSWFKHERSRVTKVVHTL